MTYQRKRSVSGLALLAAAAVAVAATAAGTAGCSQVKQPKYGREAKLWLPGTRAQVWAVAPAVNLSGQRQVDPLLQADLLFEQLQQVRGLTVVPVNRVAEVYAALRIEKVQSEEQAAAVCDLLGCDALVVPTVTMYDPYNPPKFGGAVQVFLRPRAGTTGPSVDPRQLAGQAASDEGLSLPRRNSFVQVADIYDAKNGSVREKLSDYAAGRFDPKGPMRAKEYLASMDRFVGFAYHDLILTLLTRPQLNPT